MTTVDDDDDDDHEEATDDAGDEASVGLEGDDEEIVTMPCPWCRAPIWEESVACEHCGKYLSTEDAPRRRPWWLLVGVVAGLACVLLWILAHA